MMTHTETLAARCAANGSPLSASETIYTQWKYSELTSAQDRVVNLFYNFVKIFNAKEFNTYAHLNFEQVDFDTAIEMGLVVLEGTTYNTTALAEDLFSYL